MILKTKEFFHKEEHINKALGVADELMIQCRERVFFCHFTNTLQSIELFNDRDLAPVELTTVTGDLKKCLSMINNDIEYEITLLHFMSYHRMAQEAFAHWKILNDTPNSDSEELNIAHGLMKMLMKLKDAHEKEKDQDQEAEDDNDGSINADIRNIQNVVKRIDKVKSANYNFSRYMDAMGFPMHTPDIDNMLKNLFEH